MYKVAIISEYNPFHKGHKYQIEQVKTLLPSAYVISIMSPNFVQRGFPAVFDKYVRGECAVRCGVDLAFSMPQVFALLSAEGFAEGGVKLAKKFGVTHLAFGVENDDCDMLFSVAKTLIEPNFEDVIKGLITNSPSLSYPVIRQKALEKVLGRKAGEFIKTPNNILAVEYVKAILRYAPEIEILPIKRVGNAHSDSSKYGDVLSASAIREIISRGENFFGEIPKETHNTVKDANAFDFLKYEEFLYSVIFTRKKEEIFMACKNVELTEIIYKNSQINSDYKSFRTSLSRKKHPETKIDRVLTGTLLGIEYDEFYHKEPEYATLLAMNNEGKEIVSALRKQEDFILLSKGVGLKKLDLKSAQIELFADRIYSRCMQNTNDCTYFLKQKPYIQEV